MGISECCWFCSGMLVQDPTKGNVNDGDAIFNRAAQFGSVQGPSEHPQPSISKSFTGKARLLSGETVSSAPQPPEVVNHTITLWSNGFTIDDGPLRRYDDPANAPFLEVIFNEVCLTWLVWTFIYLWLLCHKRCVCACFVESMESACFLLNNLFGGNDSIGLLQIFNWPLCTD